MKKILVTVIAGVAFTLGVITTSGFIAGRETEKIREMDYPRLEAAIAKMQDAVDYMENAPNDFGGHKAVALRDTRQAIVSLKLAIDYRTGQNLNAKN